MSTLVLRGNFSQGEMHSWIGSCLPEVPERINSSDENLLIFKNVFVETFLVCKYLKGEAEFKSDNISTISIVKDFITKEATTRHIKIDLQLSRKIIFSISISSNKFFFLFKDINDASIEHFIKLVEPKLKSLTELKRNHEILQALLELNVQNDDEFELLSEKYKNLLRDKQNIEEKFQSESSNLDRLISILAEFFVNKNKFKGINVRNKLETLLEALNNYKNGDNLVDLFGEK
jgi:Bardet-Biedl syndrome 7 protein